MQSVRVPSPLRPSVGFSLVELAVVVFVIALLIGSAVLPLQSRVEQRRISETQRLLEQAREKLFAYASQYGYFPCPASDTSNGQEPAGTNHATGYCPSYHGFLPAALLAFSPVDAQGFAIDAWGQTANRIRYAVSDETVNGVATPFTRINGMRTAGPAGIGTTQLFRVCASGIGINSGSGSGHCGTALTLASTAVAVIWSVGPNGPTGGTNAHEAENPNPNGGSADRVFVSRTRSTFEDAEFDDLLTWISSALLVDRLVKAGQLP